MIGGTPQGCPRRRPLPSGVKNKRVKETRARVTAVENHFNPLKTLMIFWGGVGDRTKRAWVIERANPQKTWVIERANPQVAWVI